jgi:hypothetical protein
VPQFPDDLLAAVGRLAVAAVRLEVVAAHIVTPRWEDAITLAQEGHRRAFTQARIAASNISDRRLRKDVVDWVETAIEMVEKVRDPVVHGLVHYDQAGDWQALHRSSDDPIKLDAGVIGLQGMAMEYHVAAGLDLARQLHT